MSAKQIIKGVYQVRGGGYNVTVIAAHGCDAICFVLREYVCLK